MDQRRQFRREWFVLENRAFLSSSPTRRGRRAWRAARRVLRPSFGGSKRRKSGIILGDGCRSATSCWRATFLNRPVCVVLSTLRRFRNFVTRDDESAHLLSEVPRRVRYRCSQFFEAIPHEHGQSHEYDESKTLGLGRCTSACSVAAHAPLLMAARARRSPAGPPPTVLFFIHHRAPSPTLVCPQPAQ